MYYYWYYTSTIVFCAILPLSTAFSSWNVLKYLKDFQDEPCPDVDLGCKLRAKKCFQDCQQGQAHAYGFCAAFGSIAAPATYGISDTVEAEERYGTRLLFKSLEGTFWAASAYCSSDAVLTCDECQTGIAFEDILTVQNASLNKLEDLKVLIGAVEMELDQQGVPQLSTEEHLRSSIKYAEVLQQTDQLLFWFSKIHDAPIFRRLFQEKVSGMDGGGIEWLVWSLNDMFHDLVGKDPLAFCPSVPHYTALQFRVRRMAAYSAAIEGTLLNAEEDNMSTILGQSFAEMQASQNQLAKKMCSSSTGQLIRSEF